MLDNHRDAFDREALLPSRVRARVLAEHAVLRDLIAVVRAAMARADEGSGTIEALRWEAGCLLASLTRHLDLEDALLAPILREIDAWGPVRAARLAADHAAQRRTIARLKHRIDGMETAPALVGTLRPFTDELMRDMEAEERDLLPADLLRDDIINNTFTG